MITDTTPTKLKNKNQIINKNIECGEEEVFEGDGLGSQVYLTPKPRLTRSTEKAAMKSDGGSSRETPFEIPAALRTPRVRLERMEMANFKVEKTDSAFLLTARTEGESPNREAVINPQPGTSGLGFLKFPAGGEAARTAGATRDLSPASSIIMHSQRDSAEDDGVLHVSDDDMDADITDDVDVITGESKVERRGPGRPPTTGEFVGIRAKRREIALLRKEVEKAKRAEEALSSSLPKGRKWDQLQRREGEIEYEISQAPTEDIAARMVEQSMKIFKIADCSNSMKGSLVKELQESAMLVRAATSVIASRAREARGGENSEELLKTIKELRAENNQLRREIEDIKARLPPPTAAPQTTSTREKRSSVAKRRRIVDSTDSEGEGGKRPPPFLTSVVDFPPLCPSQRAVMREEDKGRGAPLKERSRIDTGLTLGRATRQVDMYPPGIREGDRTEYDALLAALTPVLENINLQRNEEGPEFKELWRQLNAIKSRLSFLRGEEYFPPLMPSNSVQDPPSAGFQMTKSAPVNPSNGVLTLEQYVSPSVIDMEAKASKSQGGGIQLQREAGPPLPAITSVVQAGGQKKKKKKKGSQPAIPQSGSISRPKERKEEKLPQPSRGRQESGGKKEEPPSPKGGWTNATKPAPPLLNNGEGEWMTVVRKGAQKGKGKTDAVRIMDAPAPIKSREGGKPPKAQTRAPSSTPPIKGGKRKGKKRRPPRTAAVVITCPEGRYKEVLRLAMDRVDPASLGIEGMLARRAVTGAQIFEVGGPQHKEKADELAKCVSEALAGMEGVRVTRPSPTAEIRVRDLCDAVEESDLVKAIAAAGKCSPDMVKVGPIRVAGRGMGTAWVRCPLAVANSLATAGRIRVGWTNVRVEALEARPLQCFRCLGKGHVRAQCPSGVDRSAQCYRCGQPGHVARDCARPQQCPVCTDLGRPAAHRAGSRACNAPKEKKKGAMGGTQTAKPINSCRRGDHQPPSEMSMATDSTPPVEEGMEAEPLLNREEKERGVVNAPEDSPPPMEEGGTPMEVAMEEPCDQV